MTQLRAPFPWFGGKSRVAGEVWRRFGDVAVYAEPFAGSLACLLGRPADHAARVETVNDIDGFIANAWRAIAAAPDEVAHHADWPSNENDLHARHSWLVGRKGSLVPRLEGDPEFFDAKIAGWWLWGMAQWIGGGFCSGDGPWTAAENEAGEKVLTKNKGTTGRGVSRQRVYLGDAGRGVSRQRVYLGDAGRGADGNAGSGGRGLVEWMRALSARLKRVRVCCGDWRRIVTPSALAPGVNRNGPRGIFLDPPYSAEAGRDMGCYGEHDSGTVAHDVREWAIQAAREHPDYRIALCGYEGEGHDTLVADHGWSVVAWQTKGGMAKDRTKGSRERIWFSPGCIPAAVSDLFGANGDLDLGAER